MAPVAEPAAAVTSTGLTKRFKAVAAVDRLDLHVPAGSVYGFLGPNGSGKTTTIRMLLGLVFPTSGSHTLLGVDFASGGSRALQRVGALVEGPAFHPYLTGRANLARLDAADRTADARTSRHRIDLALERVGLGAAAGKRYRAYSLGMRQRLGIAAALLQPRDLLILDEPTNGLDPQGTREVRALVADLAGDGVTVFLSSHLLGEVEQVCSHVGVMSAGRLVWQGELAELRARQAARVRVETTQPDGAARVLAAHGLAEISCAGPIVTALLGTARPEKLVAELVHAGVDVCAFAVERAALEEQFVELTGEGFDVSA
ncbi:MAG TPA: ATP-binding cassette domain-containing protein [Jatrophihabitans sp.]|nr:ATP-binding cassette domain-containing protein [Jatrophihabitans sp.]